MTDIVTIYVDLFECVNTHTRIYTCSTEVDFILIGVDGSGRTDVEFYFFFFAPSLCYETSSHGRYLT